MANATYPAPLLARAGVRDPQWSGVIEVKRFDGLRDSSLQAALQQIVEHGPSVVKVWEKDRHPPMVEIHPDAIAVTDGRHRMLAAAAAGISSMPVRVRVFDGEGDLLSDYHTLAAIR